MWHLHDMLWALSLPCGVIFCPIAWKFSSHLSHLLSIWQYYNFLHSYYGNLEICGNLAERNSFCIVSLDSSKTARKLCLSTKFQHLEIRWNYDIFRSCCCPILAEVIRNPKVSSTMSTPFKAAKTFSDLITDQWSWHGWIGNTLLSALWIV